MNAYGPGYTRPRVLSYEMVAAGLGEVLRQAREIDEEGVITAVQLVASELGERFKEANERFDKRRFYRDCGIE